MSDVETLHRPYHSHRDTKGSAFTGIANHLAGISFAVADYFENPENAVFISKLFYGTMLVFLLGMAGVMSGLTLALFTLDIRRLRGYTTGSSIRLKRQALRVLPLLENPHWTLCTLLTCNAAAVETLPLVLDHMVQTLAAIVLSVLLVLVFGEILPQAFFAKHALQVSSFFAGFVGILMIITSPVSWTFGWVLDALVGHKQHSLLRRTELKQLLRLRRRHQKLDNVVARKNHLEREMDLHHSSPPHHSHRSISEVSPLVRGAPTKKGSRSLITVLKRWTISHLPSKMRGSISVSSSDSDNDDDPQKALQATVNATIKKQTMEDNEMKIMLGALSLSELQTKDVMPARVNNIFFLEKDEEITKDVVAAVFNHGFSRIPVFCSERKEFTSYFLARSLICFIYPQATWSVRSSPGTMEILKRKRARLAKQADDAQLTNEWIASQPTLVQDLPQHEALYCSADTVLGEVYEDLITLHSPIVFVLKSEVEQPPPQLDHTGHFSNYGTMGEEDLGMSFTATLARQKVTIADPVTPLVPTCQGVRTYSSKAHGVFSGTPSMAVSPEPIRSCTSLPSVWDSDEPMAPALDHHRYHHFQQRYLKLVEEGPTAGMLTFEDVVEVVHGISVVDEFDWESHGRIQSEWRNRLAVARVIQRGSSFIKPPREGHRDRSESPGDGDSNRRLLHNLGLESTTRTSEAFNFSFSKHATRR